MASADTFEEYVAARYATLTRTAYLLCGNHHDAEDLVQTALVKAVGVWKRIEGSPDAYVRRILVNENISRWRRHRGREVLTDRAPEGVAPAEPEDTLALRQALASLAPRQRAVVVLRYYEDLTERETAEILGIAVGTVKSQARDALARLRQALPDLGLDLGLDLDLDREDRTAPSTSATTSPAPQPSSAPDALSTTSVTSQARPNRVSSSCTTSMPTE